MSQPDFKAEFEPGAARPALSIATLFALALCLCCSHDVNAEYSFKGLGHLGGNSSLANGISADGQFVAGSSVNASGVEEAFRWSETGGLSGLSSVNGGRSAANAISEDGSVVVGRSGSDDAQRAFRWTSATGMVSLGLLNDGISEANAVSGNGDVIAGFSGKPASGCSISGPGNPTDCDETPIKFGTEVAFRWAAGSGMVPLGTLPAQDFTGSSAATISSDGTVITGQAFGYRESCAFFTATGNLLCIPERSPFSGFVVDAPATMQPLGSALEVIDSYGMSPDGIFIVGQVNFLAGLSFLDGNAAQLVRGTRARDLSDDGTLIVGGGSGRSSDEGGPFNSAFIVRGSSGANLKTLLMREYGLDLTGWQLSEAVGIAADGLTITGNGFNPLGNPEAWLARLDRFPTTQELDEQPPYLITGINRVIQSAVLPGSRSPETGELVTVSATIVNSATRDGASCRISLAEDVPFVLDYQRTNPLTNLPVGLPNQPVDIAAQSSQTFVIGLTPTAAMQPREVALSYGCANSQPASILTGVNTLLLSASDTPVPDIVALAVTPGNDGIMRVGTPPAAAAFAMAAVNVGTADIISVSADTGGITLPVSLTICQTDPGTGQCMAAPVESIALNFAAGATPTFSVFLSASGDIPLDPAVNRIFVNFRDSGGATRGLSSVAVTSTP